LIISVTQKEIYEDEHMKIFSEKYRKDKSTKQLMMSINDKLDMECNISEESVESVASDDTNNVVNIVNKKTLSKNKVIIVKNKN
jgi:hypothetical protein